MPTTLLILTSPLSLFRSVCGPAHGKDWGAPLDSHTASRCFQFHPSARTRRRSRPLHHRVQIELLGKPSQAWSHLASRIVQFDLSPSLLSRSLHPGSSSGKRKPGTLTLTFAWRKVRGRCAMAGRARSGSHRTAHGPGSQTSHVVVSFASLCLQGGRRRNNLPRLQSPSLAKPTPPMQFSAPFSCFPFGVLTGSSILCPRFETMCTEWLNSSTLIHFLSPSGIVPDVRRSRECKTVEAAKRRRFLWVPFHRTP